MDKQMVVLYETLGGAQTFVLPRDYEDIARYVIQDYEAADEILALVAELPVGNHILLLNTDDPQYIERWTREG